MPFVPAHMFVDESKDRGCIVAAAIVAPGELARARRMIRGFVMPGQRRIHFHKESDGRRKRILDGVEELSVRVAMYDGSAHPRRHQRSACLLRLIQDAAAQGVTMLAIERDESVLDADRKLLYRAVRDFGCHEDLQYRFPRAYEEPLLAIPDAIAWCWQRGGQWKRRVSRLVDLRNL